MNRKRTFAAAAALLAILLAVIGTLLLRSRVHRHRVFRPATQEAQQPVAARGIPPVAQWTQTFEELDGKALAALLAQIEQQHPDLYAKYSLGYLHARALIESDDPGDALQKLEPYLAKGHPFRDRALYHRASIADGEEASRYRTELITTYRDSMYRDEAIDDELEYLSDLGDPAAMIAFAEKLAPSASTERRREMSARIVELLVKKGDVMSALTRGLALLNGSTADDAADRVTRALDRGDVLARLTIPQRALFGETFQKHRHFDRAIALLQSALKQAYTDDLQFSLGRSYFGAEKFAEAQAAYLRGAAATKTPAQQCTFFWHAARAAQLRGDDATAEQLMTQAIAVKGKFPATLAALTQRIRTRLKHARAAEAASDLALLRKMAGNERAILEGSLAFGVARGPAGLPVLRSVPPKLLNAYDRAEFAYWRARALESSNPPEAFREYLSVLRADVPTHFAYFARKRLDSAAMAAKLERELKVREEQVANLIAAKKFDLARRVQTDRVLLSSKDRAHQLQVLASIYRQIPAYREVLELQPAALPQLPAVDPRDPSALLMALGLHDEAEAAIEKRWPLRPLRSALTRAYALNRGGSSKASIYAIEVMMKSVPKDFHPDLLPRVVRQLLYPRYFYDSIAGDAQHYGADPSLVLSIMREESRFNPRAKSQAAARGLLQFIITTARDIGRDIGLVDVDPEDLYDPRLIIRLGAKYISELGKRFGGNRYRVAAAYNAGPEQVAQWERLQPAPGDDFFLTAVNFDETKDYVRKVMNSYERYVEIYGNGAPAGGLRAEP